MATQKPAEAQPENESSFGHKLGENRGQQGTPLDGEFIEGELADGSRPDGPNPLNKDKQSDSKSEKN